MLADDRIDDLDKVVVDAVDEDSMLGTLMKSGTIDLYVAAVAELHKIQYTTGSNKEPILRGLALRGLLENCKHSQDDNNQKAFVDCGASGITAGYTDAEFLHLQEVLLKESNDCP